MKAVNIQWDIDIDEALLLLDVIEPAQAAKELGISPEKYIAMTTEERHNYTKNIFRHFPKKLEEFMALPKEVEIHPDLHNEDEISEWLSDEYSFCHKGFELIDEEAEIYVLKVDGNYYAGPNEKYFDMYNISGSGPLGAKKMTLKEVNTLREHFQNNDFETEIEIYDPRIYLERSLHKIIRYDENRILGKDPGYAIENLAKNCLRYLNEIK